MGAFRGFGDDALKVQADKRQESVQRTQIAASERASQRAAGGQVAALAENARQADMGDARANKQLDLGAAAQQDDVALKRQGLAQGAAAQQDDVALKREGLGLQREGLAADLAGRKEDLNLKLQEQSRAERQLKMNEDTYAKMQDEVNKQKAAQDELNQEDTSAQLAILRAAALSDGPLDRPWADKINNLRGVAYGDPGSITLITGIKDPKTGARYGVGIRKIGEDGKPIDSILDPADFLPKLRASMSPDKWLELHDRIVGGQSSRMGDRYSAVSTAETRKHLQEQGAQGAAMSKINPGPTVKSLREEIDNLTAEADPKRKGGPVPGADKDLEAARNAKSGVLKTLAEQTAGKPAEAAPMSGEPEWGHLNDAAEAPKLDSFNDKEKAELIDIRRRTLEQSKGDKAKAQELFDAVAAKRFGDRVKPAAPTAAPAKAGVKAEEDSLYTGNTELAPDKETEFRKWVKDNGVFYTGVGREYDLRKTFLDGVKPDAEGRFATEDIAQYSKKGAPAAKNPSTAKGEAAVKEQPPKGGEAEPQPGGASLTVKADEGKPADEGMRARSKSLSKPLIEQDQGSQKSGSNKLPEAVSAQFTTKQVDSLTDDDKKALADIHTESMKKQVDPSTKLTIDPEKYRKQKTKEYFEAKKVKHDEEFNRLFGHFLK